MEFLWGEKPESGATTHKPPSKILNFWAAGTTDGEYVKAVALANTSPMITTISGNLFRQDVRVDSTGYDMWDVAVPYGPKNKETGQFTFSFDTTGGTIHVKASKATVNKYPPDAPDCGQLIGVNGDEVAGVDVVIPMTKIKAKFTHALGFITTAYVRYLHELTGKVNSDTFMGYSPGEVLFLGGIGSDGTDSPATVDYEFACSKNMMDLVVGGVTGIEKAGWDVSWIKYKDSVTDGKPTKEAKFVYIERVYERANLSMSLGFGGS